MKRVKNQPSFSKSRESKATQGTVKRLEIGNKEIDNSVEIKDVYSC